MPTLLEKDLVFLVHLSFHYAGKQAQTNLVCHPQFHTLTAPDKWLVEKKTFHEQGVKPDEELYYSKKFFVSDDQIDKDEPYTLHLLYIEALRNIIEGRIHVTRVDARDFAAFQMQIVYGDHNPAVHVPGFMEYVPCILLSNSLFSKNIFFPLKFRTEKNIEQQALTIHKRLVGYKEETAKFRYVQLVRSLKSYGVTYYHGKTSVHALFLRTCANQI